MSPPNSTFSMRVADSTGDDVCNFEGSPPGGYRFKPTTGDDICNFEGFPPGYRFKPTDEEIITYYVSKKVKNQPLPWNKFIFEDIYKMKPHDLLGKYKHVWPENEAYFFTPRDRKYPNGRRPNRRVLDGHWKANGADKRISCGETVGLKRNLVYYIGKPPQDDKIDWQMYEYREGTDIAPSTAEHNKDMRLNDFVLCKIYKKREEKAKKRATQDNGGECQQPPSSAVC